MDPARQVAQLLQREVGLLPCRLDQIHRGRIAVRGALLGHSQVQRERHQPLLGAVVEVPLDAPPLVVCRRDDARARVLELRHLRGELGVGIRAEQLQREPAVESSEGAQGGDPDEQDERTEGHQRKRLAERVHAQPLDPISVRERLVVDRREQQAEPEAEHRHRDGEAEDSERELDQQECEVLPGRGIRQARREARPPAPTDRVGAIRAGDLRADEGADHAPLEVGEPAPRVHASHQHRDADQGDRGAEAE